MFAYAHRDGHPQVSAHLDETEEWLISGDGTVSPRVTVEDTDLLDEKPHRTTPSDPASRGLARGRCTPTLEG